MKWKTYHAPNSGIAAYAGAKDYIVIQFKTGERYRYDAKKPGPRHVEEMKSRARRTSGLTTYINQHVRENYAAKLSSGPASLETTSSMRRKARTPAASQGKRMRRKGTRTSSRTRRQRRNPSSTTTEFLVMAVIKPLARGKRR